MCREHRAMREVLAAVIELRLSFRRARAECIRARAAANELPDS